MELLISELTTISGESAAMQKFAVQMRKEE
jgi:hypothetical protein